MTLEIARAAYSLMTRDRNYWRERAEHWADKYDQARLDAEQIMEDHEDLARLWYGAGKGEFVSRVHIEQIGGRTLVVYPAQDGQFRFVVYDGSEREPKPSAPFVVRVKAIRAGRESLKNG